MTLRTLDAYLQLPRRRYLTALEWHAAAIGSIAAAVLLGGYGFGIEQLTYLIPGFPTMRLNTAAALMALSLGYADAAGIAWCTLLVDRDRGGDHLGHLGAREATARRIACDPAGRCDHRV
jgi:hypothetical protein